MNGVNELDNISFTLAGIVTITYENISLFCIFDKNDLR